VVLFVTAIAIPMITAAEVVVPIDSVQKFVNIRAEADADSDVIGRLYQGDSMSLVQSIDGWHEIEIEPGLNGYISADWTKVLSEAELQTAAEAEVEELPEAAEMSEPEIAQAQSAEPVPETSPEEVVEEAPVEESESEKAVEGGIEEGPVEEATVEEPAPEPPVEEAEEEPEAAEPEVVQAIQGFPGAVGPPGAMGPAGPPGPQGATGAATIEGSVNFLTKFTEPTVGGSSQIYDDGRNVGIGTTEPKQRLEVNGSIQIHERNSSVAGLMITQSSGETGYIMHNRGSTLTIGAGSVDRITIDRVGNVGIGQERPSQPLEMASGAHVTAGGVWTNKSSRQDKENIADLTVEEALAVLAELEPVHFNYKVDATDEYVGFIAEDVPEMVTSKDRTGLSAMDIVAVLTKVVQAQQERIEELEAELVR
jgi:hypothetical protein